MSEEKFTKGSLVKVKKDIRIGTRIIPLGMEGVITEQMTLDSDTFLLGDVIKVFFENGSEAVLSVKNGYVGIMPEATETRLKWIIGDIRENMRRIRSAEEDIKSRYKTKLCARCQKELTKENRWSEASEYCQDCGKIVLYDKLTAWNPGRPDIIDKQMDDVMDGLLEKLRYNVKSRIRGLLADERQLD